MRPDPRPHRRWTQLLVGRASGRGPVPLRPLTVIELVDEPFTLLREHLRTLVLLAGAVLVPQEIVAAWLQRGTLGGLGVVEMMADPLAAQVALEGGNTAMAETLLLQLLASVTVGAVLTGLLVRVGLSAALGERLGPMDAVRATVGRWPALVALEVLAAVAVFGLFAVALALVAFGGVAGALLGVLLVLAAMPVGVVLYVLLLVAPVVLVAEDAGPMAALRRSVELVRPRFWPVLAVSVLVVIVSSLVQSALATLPTLGTFLVGFEDGWAFVAVGSIAAGVVLAPYSALVAVLVYLDARVRQEAIDVQIRADQDREGAPAAP